ncbi:hypothetical protein JW964_12685 [candidate division KSB1 bacterium]|nr:hypothetical protein [candidate division KSB1 bacterium]
MTDRKELTDRYHSDLKKEMLTNRDKIGIWFWGDKEYYVSKVDDTIAILAKQFEEFDEDDF